jgi:hypothetical protein
MKSLVLFVTVSILVSCSSIDVKQTSPISFDTLFISRVEGRKEITLEPNESKSGRVFVGLISAGPIGAIATANTEEDFSDPKAFEYTLSIQAKTTKVIVSRSIAEVGSCVEVISPDDSEIELLRVISLDHCAESYNK